MIVQQGAMAVVPSPNGEGDVFGWEFTYLGKTWGLGIQLSPDEQAEGEELNTRVHSLSTEDMGIAQRTEALSQKIQEAIFAGETQKAQELMAQLSSGGSFYQQEWEACHRILKPTAEKLVTRIAQGLNEAAELWGLGKAQAPELGVAWIQALTYGGQTGICHPAYVLTQGEGACGAKSYFIYLLLKALGQNPGLFGSQDYNHFMVGVEKGSGKSKDISGKKYYFLETTDSGWKPGQIPDDRRDLDSWDGFFLE